MVARGEVDFDTNYASNFVRGIDPVKDIHWVTDPSVKPIERFVEGRIDAFLGFPPEPATSSSIPRWTAPGPNISAVCWVAMRITCGNTRSRPSGCCARSSKRRIFAERATRRLVDGGFTARYDYALQTLSELPYDKWRDYDAEDTVRFYALRMREAGFIKSPT